MCLDTDLDIFDSGKLDFVGNPDDWCIQVDNLEECLDSQLRKNKLLVHLFLGIESWDRMEMVSMD